MFKKGDLLECVDKSIQYCLTAGRVYTCVKQDSITNVDIINDKMHKVGVYPYRFKLAQPLKEGDKVRIVKLPECHRERGCCPTPCKIGETGTLSPKRMFICRDGVPCPLLTPEHLTKEVEMSGAIYATESKYDELKRRIEALDDGWNAEANEILQEINAPYQLIIPTHDKDGDISILGYKVSSTFSGERRYGQASNFYFDSQCEKMSAFKQALIWLLDHSDIKKDDKEDKIKELEDKVNDIQKEIKELKHA